MTYIEWAALGTFLALLELFVPGVYLVWFGLAGLLLSGLTYFYEISLMWQLIWFSISSAILAGIGFSVYRKVLKRETEHENYPHLNDLASQYVGKIVTLQTNVVDNEAKVKVGDTVWLAKSETPMKAGDKAKVIGVEKGVVLIIEPTTK